MTPQSVHPGDGNEKRVKAPLAERGDDIVLAYGIHWEPTLTPDDSLDVDLEQYVGQTAVITGYETDVWEFRVTGIEGPRHGPRVPPELFLDHDRQPMVDPHLHGPVWVRPVGGRRPEWTAEEVDG